MKTIKYKCGCTAELHREAWTSLCPEHEAEFQAIHQRWAEEHAANVKDHQEEAERQGHRPRR